MRNIFIKKLTEEAKKNKNIYLLTGDLGYNSFEEFASMFPNQFINCGVAENNMVGISSGLALTGKKVFVYSIIPFLIFRSLEQIRNNICHNNLDVKIIGGGGGAVKLDILVVAPTCCKTCVPPPLLTEI